jgi:hypothetical protein
MSEWPTSIGTDGSSAASIELVTSGDRALVRQALYHMQAVAELQDRGHLIRAVLAPLIGDDVRISIPVVIERTDGPDACAYTQCEPWTPARMAALKKWLRDLREVSDSEVIVVAREPSAEVAALADVKEFIHLPYDQLPPSE